MRRFLATVVLPLLSMGHAGCLSSGPGDKTPDLHLAPQSGERYQCGPTTLSSVLAFHGARIPEEEISQAIYSPTARGVLLQDQARFARSRGFGTTIVQGTVDDLKRTVAARQPPIVLLDLGVGGLHLPHFTAVTGVTENGLFLLGPNPKNDFVSRKLFERQWNRAGNHYLLLTPPVPAPSS